MDEWTGHSLLRQRHGVTVPVEVTETTPTTDTFKETPIGVPFHRDLSLHQPSGLGWVGGLEPGDDTSPRIFGPVPLPSGPDLTLPGRSVPVVMESGAFT